MTKFESPTHTQNYDFLLRLYFGAGEPLKVVIKRAYLDLSRTVHRLGKNPDRLEIMAECENLLLNEILNIRELSFDQASFDDWHESLCKQLISVFSKHGFKHFHIGQAQKWINMTLKYIYLYPVLATSYQNIYNYCHIPIDNIILRVLSERNLPSFLGPYEAWSRLDDYQKYLKYQLLVRGAFQGSAPLAIEFHLWQS